MFRPHIAIALAALAIAACRTTVSSQPPGIAEAVVMRSLAARAWDVWDAASRLGTIVRYETPGSPERAWYSVRNPHQQELGLVDLEGRAWRYKPHLRDPEWLGTGTVLAGARRILDGGPASALVEVSIVDLAARPVR